MLTALLGIVGFCFLVTLWSLTIETDKNRREKMTALQKAYGEIHNHGDVWIIEEVPTTKSATNVANQAWKEGERIRALLESYSQTNSETEELWRYFKNFAVTVHIDLMRTVANPTSRDEQGLREGKELALVPRKLAEEYLKMESEALLLAWRDDLGISLGAIKWPDKFLVAALYHEFLHGKRHPKSNPKRNSKGGLAHAIEEMEAHRLESAVMSQATGGRYLQKYDDIIKRAGGINTDPKKVIASITLEDLQEFDRLLEMKDAGLFTASFAIAHHVLGLGQYLLEKQGKPKEEWGKFFLWLFNEEGLVVG